MPRPKVRPEDRQRVRKACLPCKTSKKRCDGKPVCSTCANKHPSLCVYPETPASPRYNEQASSPRAQVSRPDADQRQDTPVGPNTSSPNARKPSEAQNDIARSPEALHMTRSRMLQNLKGDQVYIGDAASLSFLQLLRQTFTRHMGPSQFTDNQRRDIMLEAERRPEAPSLLNGRHHLNQKRALVESYFTATAGILHIYSKAAVLSSLELVDLNEETPPSQYAGVCLTIAIGGQCRAQSSSDIHYEQVYFNRGQQGAFKDLLEDPSLDLVRNFLLMAFFMLGACRRNAAFMYLGVAARAAHALGLHDCNSYHLWAPEDRDVRLQTWKSLRILDLIVSSILGRPTATTTQQIHSSGDVSDVRTSRDVDFPPAVEATYRVCTIINDIIHKIYPDKSVSTVAAEEVLERLGSWSAELPPELRVSSIQTFPGSPDHDHVIGGLHVACSYYFAVMLVTRPFLVVHSMSRLPESSERSSRSGTRAEGNETDNGPGVLKLAQVCVDSAMFLAQTCHDALQAGLILNNMCLIKAWIFAAGLILGFSMFTHTEAKQELEDSLRGAREVLQKLSNHSPQAGHYHDILTSLSEAIVKHREQVKARRRRATSRYVDRIFSFGSDTATNQQFPTTGTTDTTVGLDAMDMNFEGAGDQPNLWTTEAPTVVAADPEAPLGPSQGVFPDWDSFALPFFDTFSMESDLLPVFATED